MKNTMSNKKKGLVKLSGEWAKHLRKWGKKYFWSTHREKEKNMIKNEKFN